MPRELKQPAERVLEGEVLGPETEREMRERLNFRAWLLDSSIPVPGTRFTIGLDALIPTAKRKRSSRRKSK